MNGCFGKWPGKKNNGRFKNRQNLPSHSALFFSYGFGLFLTKKMALLLTMPPSKKVAPHLFRPGHNQAGIIYLFALFAIVLIGISLMVTGQHWSIIMKRDREAELLFRGTRIKVAIERYAADYEVQKATRSQRYPLKLEDLTKKPRRYLPVVYLDPITREKFELIKIGNEIRGVRSVSKDVPLDQVNFKGAGSYYAIKFQASGATNCGPTPQNPTLPTNCQKSTSPTEEQPEEIPPGVN